MRNLLTYTATFILVQLIALEWAYGQQDTMRLDKLSLKELLNVKITTASKTSQTLELASSVVTVITKEQIKIRNYQSLLDVMYDLPDVKVDDKASAGIRNSFTVRGTQGAEKFIILLDGIIISSPSGEAMPIMQNYPVSFAEQIEVLYGPASALYGANAVSGIINIITTRNFRKDILVDVSSTAGSYGYTNTTLLLAKKLGESVNLLVSGQYSYDRQPDDHKLYPGDSLLNMNAHSSGVFNTIYGPVIPVAPVTPNYQAPMAAYNIFATLHSKEFAISFFKNYTRTPTAFGNNTNNAVYNKEVYMAQGTSMFNGTYKKTIRKVTFTSILTASEYKLNPKSNYRNLYTAMEPAYKYSISSMKKAEEQIDYKPMDKLTVTAGAGYESYYSIPQSADLNKPVNEKDYVHGNYVGSESYYRPQGLPAQFYFIRYNNIGTYVQAQYSATDKLDLTIGARYDINSRYGSSLNPKLGVVYKATNSTIIKLLYGSAFLAPSPSDSYVQFGSFDTPDSGRTYHSYFLHLPNPGLRPIRSHNAEVNLRQYFNDNTFVTIDGYFTLLTGLLAYGDDNTSTRLYHNMFNGIPVDYVEVFVNQNRQKNYGGSIQFNSNNYLGKVQFNSYAVCSYVNGVREDPQGKGEPYNHGYELEFISPFMFRVGSDIKAGKFTCSPRLLVMGRQHVAGISDTSHYVLKRQTIAGYALLNLAMRYSFTKRLSVFTNVTNALNQHYRSVSFNMDLANKNTELFYGQRQDPIRFMAGVNVSF